MNDSSSPTPPTNDTPVAPPLTQQPPVSASEAMQMAQVAGLQAAGSLLVGTAIAVSQMPSPYPAAGNDCPATLPEGATEGGAHPLIASNVTGMPFTQAHILDSKVPNPGSFAQDHPCVTGSSDPFKAKCDCCCETPLAKPGQVGGHCHRCGGYLPLASTCPPGAKPNPEYEKATHEASPQGIPTPCSKERVVEDDRGEDQRPQADCCSAPESAGQRFVRILQFLAPQFEGISAEGWEDLNPSMRCLYDAATEQFLQPLEREVKNWQDTAKHYANGVELARGKLITIGDHFGPTIYLDDEGGFSDSMLLSEVPELVIDIIHKYQRVSDNLRAFGFFIITKMPPAEACDVTSRGGREIQTNKLCAMAMGLITRQEAQLESMTQRKAGWEKRHQNLKRTYDELVERCMAIRAATGVPEDDDRDIVRVIADIASQAAAALPMMEAVQLISQLLTGSLDFTPATVVQMVENQCKAVKDLSQALTEAARWEHTVNMLCATLTTVSGHQQPNGWGHEQALELATSRMQTLTRFWDETPGVEVPGTKTQVEDLTARLAAQELTIKKLYAERDGLRDQVTAACDQMCRSEAQYKTLGDTLLDSEKENTRLKDRVNRLIDHKNHVRETLKDIILGKSQAMAELYNIANMALKKIPSDQPIHKNLDEWAIKHDKAINGYGGGEGTVLGMDDITQEHAGPSLTPLLALRVNSDGYWLHISPKVGPQAIINLAEGSTAFNDPKMGQSLVRRAFDNAFEEQGPVHEHRNPGDGQA